MTTVMIEKHKTFLHMSVLFRQKVLFGGLKTQNFENFEMLTILKHIMKMRTKSNYCIFVLKRFRLKVALDYQ